MFNLDDLFTYSDVAPLPIEEEVRLIASAKDGDDEAAMRLLTTYGPALRSALSRANNAADDVEDLRMTAVEGVLAAIRAHDPEKGPRLAGTVTQYVANALAEAAADATPAFRIPPRTLTRYQGIIREADGDVEVARELAPSRSMTTETFDSIRAAVTADSVDEHVGRDESGPSVVDSAAPVFATSPVVDVEDRILVDMAFRAVDDDDERICRLAYGFTEYDPQPDAEIAHRMGLTRPTVQRRRGKALSQMRKALGVTHA